MCGIIYAEKNGGSVAKSVMKRYRQQSHRGRQGFAFLELVNGVVNSLERASEEKEILEKLKNSLSNKILFHHRLPTSTVNLPEVTHPIVVENEKLKHNYYVVHNGVLRNEEKLKGQHEKLGFTYNTVIKNTMTYEVGGEIYYGEEKETFNDSESFAIDLALYLDGLSEKLESEGSIAFICLQTDKDDNAIKLFFGRNGGNPLVVEDNGDLFCIKSEGSGHSIIPDMLYQYTIKDRVVGEEREITRSPLNIGTWVGRVSYTPRKWNYETRQFEDEKVSDTLGLYEEERNVYGGNVNDENERRLPIKSPYRSSNFVQDENGVWIYKESSEERKLEDDFGEPVPYLHEEYRNHQLVDLYEEFYFIEDTIEDLKAELDNQMDSGLDTEIKSYDITFYADEKAKVSQEIQYRESILGGGEIVLDN